MARKRVLSDDQVAAVIAKAISNSENMTDGRLATERDEVERYYRGELPQPLHKGDSKYVSRDVFDSVDSMRSTVLEAYSTNSRIVTFKPEKGETVGDAKAQTEYARHVFFKKNNGDDVLYETMTDGLMKRFCPVKVYYDEESEEQDYEFDALTSEELTMKTSEFDKWDFKEVSRDANGLLSGTFTVTTKARTICVETIQPEDFLISNMSVSIAKANFVAHRTQVKRSTMIKRFGEKAVEGMSFNDGPQVGAFDLAKQTRFDPVDGSFGQSDSHDDSVQEVTLYEVYIRMDMDGSGIAKLWKVDYASKKVLGREQVSRAPFECFVPLPVPHAFFGDNYARSVIPIQNARTVLIRQIINHALITNNPRQQVVNGTLLNPSELLENRLGGIVNVKRLDGIAPIPQAQLNPYVFALISMIDEDKEEVTGISKLSQGLNKDAISTQNAQGMVEQLISASQQRTKIIARRFGLFLMNLFLLISDTAIDYVEEDEYVDVTGLSVPVNPKGWVKRTSASVELTLGYGEQMQEAKKWQDIDAYFNADPELKARYSPEKRAEVINRALQYMGIEDGDILLIPPDQVPPKQPDPMLQLQMAREQSQIEMQKSQAQATMVSAQAKAMDAKANLIKAMTDAKFKDIEAVIAQGELANRIWVDRNEMELARNAEKSTAVLNPSA